MLTESFTRRRYFSALAGSAAAMASGASLAAQPPARNQPQEAPPPGHERRIAWWRQAKFGMFIHWGLYSVLGRHEWAMENEGIPVAEYEQLAKRFNPRPYPMRQWAKLAKAAGQKYMVMTTKHHEGFCLFNTATTNYCAPKQAAGRDLVKEFVESVRAEGLRVGFYYSLMDWHHPDGAICAHDEAARRRFVDYIHTQIRELMSNYGKIDILWYDVSWPLDAAGWESVKMNEMVFKLQPDILVNNRNRLAGDFSTPEQRITAEAGKDWESCMTMNNSWGYQAADDNWKTPRDIAMNLARCSAGGGNYLLNIGPRPDGSVPEDSIRILQAVGEWTGRNGEAIYGTDRCQPNRSNYCLFTRKGNTLYIHVYFWPGDTVTVAGLKCKVNSARLLPTGNAVKVTQDDLRVQFTGLPAASPDIPVAVIAAECDSDPTQDTLDIVRIGRPRRGVNI